MTTRDLSLLLLLSSPVLGFLGCGSGTKQAGQGGSMAGGAGGSKTGGTSGSNGGSTGGSTVAGTGGSTVGPADAAPDVATVAKCIDIADDLIADFKTDNGLNPVDGREGGFYVYGDGSIKGQFDPPLVVGESYPTDTATGNDHCSGPGSFHTKSSGWGVWGSALGADFMSRITTEAGVSPDGKGFKGTYDASKYKGVSFWATSTAPLTRVQVSFPDVYTDGLANPAAIDSSISPCVYSSGASNCSPYLVKFGDSQFPQYMNYQIDTTWKRFDVFFEDTLQDQYNKGFHTADDKLDLKHLTSMAIQVNAVFTSAAITPNDFEIWVDDVYFIE